LKSYIQITKGIEVAVESKYQGRFVSNEGPLFVYNYTITITNHSDQTVRLVNRHWDIFDSMNVFTQVNGEGVIGQQPILLPGDSHSYTSGCHLRSDFGAMSGFYGMENVTTGQQFEVDIPKFLLVCPTILN
jgi:ApaG protein